MEISEPYTFNDESLSDMDASNNLELLPEPLESPAKAKKSLENSHSTPELTVKEGDLVKRAMEKLPEAVLPHVVSAAEKNKPLEAVYERRHEVKDEPTFTTPVAIGSVIADRPKPQPPIPDLIPSPDFSNEETLPPQSTQTNSPKAQPSYKQAVHFGFLVAVIIIIAETLYIILK